MRQPTRYQGSLRKFLDNLKHLGPMYISAVQNQPVYKVGIGKSPGEFFDLIHQISRLIGMNYFQIQVILTQEKNMQI